MVTIEARGLSKRLGNRMAVQDLSFVAHSGEVVGLLGPNGAGKTTTIRLLSTVLTPTSGEFTIAGIPWDRPTEIRGRIGVLPESAGYPAHLTGTAYLTYHARLSGMARRDADRLADRLLAEVGLASRAATLIDGYSRGMRQRLGIARSLITDPAVLFLDEPTLGLDPAGQTQILTLVRDIARDRGATVVLSTHSLSVVEEVCTHVLILERGVLLAAGSIGELLRGALPSRAGRLRVATGSAAAAIRALAAVPDVSVDQEGPEVLVLTPTRGASDGALNAALRAVLDAGLPVLSFETEGVGLAAAFLALTGEEGGR